MFKWLNFLHFYQPPTTPKEILDEVVKSSYQSWVDFLNKYKKVRVTMNFTGCLTEMLYNSGYKQLLKEFSKITSRGQIELVESAAFHPILPLLPDKEIVKQIEINHDINRRRFGRVYRPTGFFLPEMAYSEKVARIIKRMGYKYIILDEVAFDGKLNTNSHELLTNSHKSRINTNGCYSIIDNNYRYKIRNIGLYVIFRNRKISQTFVPETIFKILEGHVPCHSRASGNPEKLSHKTRSGFWIPNQVGNDTKSKVIITATDGELYGHRYWNWWSAYIKALKYPSPRTCGVRTGENIKTKNSQTPPLTKGGLGGVNDEAKKQWSNETTIKTLTISEYLKSLKAEKIIRPLACSWESTPAELKRGVPYALWSDPKNKIHTLLWQLANFALKLNWGHLKDPNHFASRLHLERGLASCTFWWASHRDFNLYSPPAWHPEQVETGAKELLNSIRSLDKIKPQSKLQAEKLFSEIRDLIWGRHWRK